MTDLQTALDHISEQLIKYRKTKPDDGNTLAEILQQIGPTLFYLEKERAKFHERYQGRINELVLAGNSVSRAENMTHVDVPEMYMLRRIMDSAYACCDAIRTQISWIKSGLING